MDEVAHQPYIEEGWVEGLAVANRDLDRGQRKLGSSCCGGLP